MIPLRQMRTDIARALADVLGIPVIRGNQSAPAPRYPYATYNIITPATAKGGTWQQHEDGYDRLLVRSIWSFTFLAQDCDESMANAIRAREWFEHTGCTWLGGRGIAVQSVTDIANRDNIISVEYERRSGFDVSFYVYDEVHRPIDDTGYIETASIRREKAEG